MTKFDYEQSIWGQGTADLVSSSPTAFRLWRSDTWFQDLPAASKILEVGCGAGQFIRAFKRLRPDWDCYGTDISVNALTAAEHYHDNVHYNLTRDDSLPYLDNSFAGILIFDVLEHVTDPAMMLREVFRVLRSGGKVYCFIPCEGDYLSWWYWLKFFSNGINWTEKYAGHINRWSRHQWLDLIKKNNFRIVNINYSEHFLGQLSGLLAFSLINRQARKKQWRQINNETFFTQLHNTSGGMWKLCKKALNTAIYWEARIGRNVPSPNMHILLQK